MLDIVPVMLNQLPGLVKRLVGYPLDLYIYYFRGFLGIFLLAGKSVE